MSDPEPVAVDITAVEEQAPELATALGALEEALGKYQEIQKEVLPMQSKGLEIPNLGARAHAAEEKIAEAMDKILPLLRKYEKNEAVLAVTMQAYQEGMVYIQGIVFGVHWTRVSTTSSKPFKRLHAEAYHMLERAQKRL